MMTLEEKSEVGRLIRQAQKIYRRRREWFDLIERHAKALGQTFVLLTEERPGTDDEFYRLGEHVISLIYADYNWFIRTVILERFKERDKDEWKVIELLYGLHSKQIDEADLIVRNAISRDVFYKHFGKQELLLLEGP